VYDKTQPGRFRYYRARYQLGDLSALMRTNISKKVNLLYGPVYQFYSFDADDKFNKVRYITKTALNGLDPATLFENQSYFGGRFALNIDTRNNMVNPQKGILWITNVRHLSGLSDTKYKVTQLNSDFSFYLPLVKNKLILANRFGGGHNFGDFEFYQAQYLGSEDNLRGYRKYRFAGRSKVYNNVELRWGVANFKTYLFPAAFGLVGFYDTGHVWDDSDNSDKWASGYGGGIWFSPLSRIVLTVTYTTSEEDSMPLVGFSWRF
ncbi:MAG TPA: BamA/TamA family outer membrane protein, partial [Chitinophagaceae bacterium]|nr:BamA/TamA family outer membrane protein [Chitinophagaceae bacterium]